MKHCINVSNYRLGGMEGVGGEVGGGREERMRRCNKDVPLAVNHYNRCGGGCAKHRGSNELRRGWKRTKLDQFIPNSRGRSCPIGLSNQLLHRPLVILSTVQHSFAKASRIKRNLKAEQHCGICK